MVINNSAKRLIKNFSFSLLSNFMSMLISSLVVLIVPRFIGTTEYGYYQLYVLYIGYVGFVQLGLNDGIYLRYGGEHYERLDKLRMNGQWFVLFVIQVCAFLVVVMASFSLESNERQIILICAGICMILTNMRGMLTYIFQTTNRIAEYSVSSVIGRITFFILSIMALVVGYRSYFHIIVADLIGRCVALSYSLINAKEIVFFKTKFPIDLGETKENFKVGIKLMLSNIASTLVIGIVKFGIEGAWSIETFGKASLTISISSLLVQFINAFALVLFPTLKRNSAENQEKVYMILRKLIIPAIYILLLFYYPFNIILSAWLPAYKDGLQYMALLFPVCIFEGRQALVNNTFLKTYRMEKTILSINVATVLLSFILTGISTKILCNIQFAMISILIVLMFRCEVSDYILTRRQKINLFRNNIEELVLVIVFVLTAWFIKSFASTLVYSFVLALFFVTENKSIRTNFQTLRSLAKNDR